MDEKLENLIEKIEKEAVEEAQQTAGEIVDRAVALFVMVFTMTALPGT